MFKIIFITLSLFALSVFGGTDAGPKAPKRFKRALIIAGGGITPAVGLGVIAGVEEKGWKPDVVLTTCGASMAAAIYNAFNNSKDSLAYARSESFYDVLHQIKVDTSSIVEMSGKFGSLMKGSNLPQFFNTNVLFLPEVLEKTFQKSEFNSGDGPKFIMVAARANFTPDDVGKPRQTQDLFTQVYFTDPETGALLQKFKSPIRKLFPDSYIAEETATITGSTTEAGARASIADPFLINPGKIDNDYFFTGAVDLFPMELAHELADEVVVTFPSSLYTGFRELAIQKTFGFSPSQRALHAIQDKSVKWIDISGIDYTNFDPQPGFLKINSRIPVGLDNFASGIQTQFDFGYYRTLEAMDLQVDRVDVRSHLREPISPKLLQKFTCKNAYAWRIPGRLLCTSDSQKGCDRMTETVCTPVR